MRPRPCRGIDRERVPSLPDDPREQRRIKNRLIVLALLLPIAQLLWLLYR